MDHRPQGTPNFDTRLIWLIGAVSTILFMVTVVSIQAGFRYAWNQEVATKMYQPDYPELVVIQAAQRAMITEPRWVNDDHTFAAIPIDQAMAQVVARQAGH